MQIGAVEAEMYIVIAKWSVQNFGLLLNRQNGTFSNYHVRARKYKLAHISGTVRRTKMKLSPNCCARCGLSRERVFVCRALWPSATTRRNGKIWSRIKVENVILKQQGDQQRSRGMFINCCHQCTRGRVGNNERQLPVSPRVYLNGTVHYIHYKPATIWQRTINELHSQG